MGSRHLVRCWWGLAPSKCVRWPGLCVAIESRYHERNGIHVSGVQSPVRWGIVGLGWAAADFVAPAMVKSTGSRLSACLGSSLDKGHSFAATLRR